MADLITHLLTRSKLDKSDKMDCSFWSTFGVPPHPVPMVHAGSSHHDKGEHEERHKTSWAADPWPQNSPFSLFHCCLLLCSLLWVWAWQKLLSLWEKHFTPVDVFMGCSCVEAFPTHNSCLLHGCYMFKALLNSPNQYREGEWWVFLLPSPLKAVLTPLL